MSADERLRQLEREAATGDAMARYRWRCECVRAGVADRAGLERGDRVRILNLEAWASKPVPPSWLTPNVSCRVLSCAPEGVYAAIYARGVSTCVRLRQAPGEPEPGQLRPRVVLLEPWNPSIARRLSLPPVVGRGSWRWRFRELVRMALEESFAMGWPLPEVRAHLRAVAGTATRGASWTEKAWAAEVGAHTGGALGKGSHSPKPTPADTPLFDKTIRP